MPHGINRNDPCPCGSGQKYKYCHLLIEQGLKAREKKESTTITSHKPDRNDPCHCGSGKKYKKCCLYKEQGLIKNMHGYWTLPEAEGAFKRLIEQPQQMQIATGDKDV